MKGEIMGSYYKKCPYCGRAMEKGSIPPGRYSLKWKSDYENRSGLNYMFNFDKKDVKKEIQVNTDVHLFLFSVYRASGHLIKKFKLFN